MGSGAVPLPGHPPPVVAEQTACFDGRHRDVRAVPEPARPPEFWPVGSSTGGAAFAGGLGLPYVDAPPIVGGGAAEVLEVHRREFRPSAAGRG